MDFECSRSSTFELLTQNSQNCLTPLSKAVLQTLELQNWLKMLVLMTLLEDSFQISFNDAALIPCQLLPFNRVFTGHFEFRYLARLNATVDMLAKMALFSGIFRKNYPEVWINFELTWFSVCTSRFSQYIANIISRLASELSVNRRNAQDAQTQNTVGRFLWLLTVRILTSNASVYCSWRSRLQWTNFVIKPILLAY